eukprot:scaffold10162_cov118-Skeletonema_dohrnii-CCMP3373.AAC.2
MHCRRVAALITGCSAIAYELPPIGESIFVHGVAYRVLIPTYVANGISCGVGFLQKLDIRMFRFRSDATNTHRLPTKLHWHNSVDQRRTHDLTMEQPNSAAGGAAGGGGGINREQMKKMSEADKEMELRANRAKALLAERHVGLKAGQVRISLCSILYAVPICLR